MEVVSGDQRICDLGNDVSDAVFKALERGLSADEVCSILVGVAADYWMLNYDPATVTRLSDIVLEKSQLGLDPKKVVRQ